MTHTCGHSWCVGIVASSDNICLIHKNNPNYRAPGMYGDFEEEDDRRYGDATCAECYGSGECRQCEGEGSHEYHCACGCGDTTDADCNRCDGSSECFDCDGEGHDGSWVNPKIVDFENWRCWTGQLHPKDIRTAQEAVTAISAVALKPLSFPKYLELTAPK